MARIIIRFLFYKINLNMLINKKNYNWTSIFNHLNSISLSLNIIFTYSGCYCVENQSEDISEKPKQWEIHPAKEYWCCWNWAFRKTKTMGDSLCQTILVLLKLNHGYIALQCDPMKKFQRRTSLIKLYWDDKAFLHYFHVT